MSPWMRAHLLLFPPACWGCGRLLAPCGRRQAPPPGYPYLCAACHEGLPWLAADAAPGAAVAAVDRLWAACRYATPVNEWIQHLKYERRDGLLRLLASVLGDAPTARAALESAELVVPVPLHRLRLWQRGFNQSHLLAHAWRRALRAETTPEALPPLAAHLLVRHRYTRPQVRMSAAERHRNVADAFSLHPRLRGALPRPGLRVLLVDDVATTGATLTACARVLRAAGAARVDALVVARA